MKRNSLLVVVNPTLGVVLLNQIITGLMRPVMSYEMFEAMHQVGGMALAILAIAHVILNWSWIRVNFLSKRGATKK